MIPKQYADLATEPGPKMLLVSLALLGTTEVPGPGNNPTILAWGKEVGAKILGNTYSQDSTPWCGLDMAVVAQRAGKTPPLVALRALSWGTFGVESPLPSLGDVLVFVRQGGGHVGLYVGEDATAYHVLGGNQGNAHGFCRVLKSQLYACRRPIYTNTPTNVRPIHRAATGKVTTSLA